MVIRLKLVFMPKNRVTISYRELDLYVSLPRLSQALMFVSKQVIYIIHHCLWLYDVTFTVIWIWLGVSQGDEVSVHYDPMIAKLVVWSQDRSSALRKLRSCLSEYNIVGLNTNVDFLMQLSAHEKFVEGDVHTDFIEQHYSQLFPKRAITDQLVSQAVLASLLNEIQTTSAQQKSSSDPHNPFTVYPMARLNHLLQRSLKVKSQDSTFNVQLIFDGSHYKIKINDGAEMNVSAKLSVIDNIHHIELDADGQISKSRVVLMDNDVYVFTKVIFKTIFGLANV